jgi:asparaginyl-tRNA synthetase
MSTFVDATVEWTDHCEKKLGVPLRVILAIHAGAAEYNVSATEKIKIDKLARLDIDRTLLFFERRLTDNTFAAGERAGAADVCWFNTLKDVNKIGSLDFSLYPAIFRWYNSMITTKLVEGEPVPLSKVTVGRTDGKWNRHRLRIKDLLAKGADAIGTEVVLKGWVRTSRSAEKDTILFIELNDGSCHKSVQLVFNKATSVGMEQVANSGGVHACISVVGMVVAPPAGAKQSMEVTVLSSSVLGAIYGGDNGEIGGKNYPMAKKAHSLEYLREKAHLRPRSKLFSATMRVRHAMAFATHKFFNERGFCYVHTPLITGADCEGAGEQFAVSTLLGDHCKASDLPVDKDGRIDFTKDFFGKRTCMTVSGQLNVETHACALSDVYTFGPTFRAENSNTSRHLAEFWMIEPEICFADLADDMALAEDYVRYCAAYALENCAEDLAYFENEYPAGEKGLTERLRNVVSSEFAQITYTEAVDLLQAHSKAGKVKFERYPEWGADLGSEHERYICEKVNMKPTIVINYPKGIKAFYMKLNDDNATVAAMDILVPKIGELIGGSQREDRLEILEQRCRESGLKPEDMWWYIDLRRYGTVPHAGFGLGFERLIMFVTGLENIRDVIPFPRVPGHAEF